MHQGDAGQDRCRKDSGKDGYRKAGKEGYRIQLIFNADLDPALNFLNKLPCEEFSGAEKDKKESSKVRNNGAGPILLKFFLNKLTMTTISLHFFLTYVRPDPGGKMNADPDPQLLTL